MALGWILAAAAVPSLAAMATTSPVAVPAPAQAGLAADAAPRLVVFEAFSRPT